MQADTNQPKTTVGQWHKTPYANLIRYVPSGVYFARIGLRGKLIRRGRKTEVPSSAERRLGERLVPVVHVVGESHLAHGLDAVAREEPVLRAGHTGPGRAERDGLNGLLWRV